MPRNTVLLEVLQKISLECPGILLYFLGFTENLTGMPGNSSEWPNQREIHCGRSAGRPSEGNLTGVARNTVLFPVLQKSHRNAREFFPVAQSARNSMRSFSAASQRGAFVEEPGHPSRWPRQREIQCGHSAGRHFSQSESQWHGFTQDLQKTSPKCPEIPPGGPISEKFSTVVQLGAPVGSSRGGAFGQSPLRVKTEKTREIISGEASGIALGYLEVHFFLIQVVACSRRVLG